ncbi:MAG TPA: carbohydrate kinase family protein [Candidatus Acidoferrales bacterium]|nr:carbohydrate kinase family protein [Candidatus Acidoferrales bacterium]
MTKFDFVGFGALNVDTLLKVERLAGAEEESFVEDYKESCGGSAANTAVGLARLGCKVGFIGKVADDREGKLQIDCFKTEGVDTAGIIQPKHGKSGSVLGFVDKKGARALYVNPGVNDTIEPREINYAYPSETKFLHYSSFVGEKSFRAQKKLLGALDSNVKISFDPGSLYSRKGFAAIEPIIRSSYVLMPNARELELLTGELDIRRASDLMLDAGVKIVAVKLGEKGCYVTDGEERLRIEPFRVKVVDTTGAGDAFCAGFLYGLIKEKSLFECGRFGNFVASRCVAQMGARAGLPSLEDLRAFFG